MFLPTRIRHIQRIRLTRILTTPTRMLTPTRITVIRMFMVAIGAVAITMAATIAADIMAGIAEPTSAVIEAATLLARVGIRVVRTAVVWP